MREVINRENQLFSYRIHKGNDILSDWKIYGKKRKIHYEKVNDLISMSTNSSYRPIDNKRFFLLILVLSFIMIGVFLSLIIFFFVYKKKKIPIMIL